MRTPEPNSKPTTPYRRPPYTRLLPWLCLVGGVLASLSLWRVQLAAIERTDQARFLGASRERAIALRTQLESASAALEDLALYVSHSPSVDFESFGHFTGPVLARNPSMTSLSWHPRVVEEDRLQWELNSPEATAGIIERDRMGELIPAASRSVYYPARWLEPWEQYPEALGFDLLSEGLRRAAVQRSLATRRLAVSEPVAILNEDGSVAYGAIAIQPVLAHPTDRSQAVGVVAGFFRVDALLAEAFTAFRSDLVDVVVSEVTDPGLVHRLTTFGSEENHESPRPRHVEQVEWGGRTWQIDFEPGTALLAQGKLPAHLLLLSGLLVSALLALLVRSLANRRLNAERLVAARTSELEATNRALAEEVRQRLQAESHLKGHQRELESRVAERTVDLERSNRHLEQEVEKRWQVELELRRSNERVERTMEAIQESIVEWDIPRDELHLDDRWVRSMGYEPDELATLEQRQKLWETCIHPDDLELVNETLARHVAGDLDVLDIQVRKRMASGEYRWFHERGRVVERTATGRALRMLGSSRDIHSDKQRELESERMAAKMREAQKLESLGVLAGGIAHDFNNLLVGILGNADLARQEVDSNSEVREMLEAILHSGQRAADLVHQMLAYTGKAPMVSTAFDLQDVVREMLSLLQSSISKKAELIIETQPAPVEGDVVQIRQIVMNLITNASDALGDDPGTIRLRTGVRHVDRETLSSSHTDTLELASGQFCFLEVADDGSGMAPETVERVFDPFYTTKMHGRGLGLAATLGILRGHGGTILVDSTPGSGTSIRVLLPVTSSALGPTDPTSVETTTREERRLDGVSVLVIDDEEPIRILVRRSLSRLGADVLEAADGQAGVEVFQANAERIDLVLLDATMPRMNGAQVLRQIRKQSSVPIVVSSGYAEQDVVRSLPRAEIVGFLEKPFPLRELLRLVDASLEGKARPLESSPEATEVREAKAG